MKLVVFGLTISSSWGNGHATLWRGLCKALARHGCRVVFYEKDVPYYASSRDQAYVPGGELVLYREWRDVSDRAMQDVADADAAMVTSFCADGIEASDVVLDARGAVRCFYDLDTPVTLAQLASGRRPSYLGPRALADFDVVFSFTGGGAIEALRSRLGGRQVLPLYGHVDPDTHRPAAAIGAYRSDLSYLGTYSEDRQERLESLFVESARRSPHRRFLIGGAQYPHEFPWAANIYFVRHLPPSEHPAFFSSSRLTLNVTRKPMAEMGWCPSGRLFEAAACGAPLLSDAWRGIDAFFRPGEEILLAHGTDDTVEALDTDDAELQRIGKRARERTLAEHTSERRARELMDAIAELSASPRAAAPMQLGA